MMRVRNFLIIGGVLLRDLRAALGAAGRRCSWYDDIQPIIIY